MGGEVGQPGNEDHVSITDVSLRDGLQNEAQVVATDDKLRLLDALCGAGLRHIELTSFVSPKWVPQLADAEDLARRASAPAGVRLSALTPNDKGLERALRTQLPEVTVLVSASETHNRKNLNQSTEETTAALAELVPAARAAGRRVRGYVSMAWGCPYEGAVDPGRAVALARQLYDLGCRPIALTDALGVASPRQSRELVRRLVREVPTEQVALHFHDTRGTALANVLAALELGIRTFDAAVASLGGCPFAPGSAGNLATEDLVYMLDEMGLPTGIDLEALIAAGNLAEAIVGRPLPGKVHRAGPFRR